MLDFPNSPSPQSGDTYQAPNGQLYFFDGDKWIGFGEPTPGANIDLTGYATESYVNSQITSSITALINGAPTNLNTLKELADAINNDDSIIAGILTTLSSKIDHTQLYVTTAAATNGGTLSYNNNGTFTFAPADLSGLVTSSGLSTTLSSYATQNYVTTQGYITNSALSGYATETYVNSQGFITTSALTGYALTVNVPTDTGDLTNGAGFITSSALSGYATESWVGNQNYLTSITSTNVTNALGYTPLQASSLSVSTGAATSGGSLSYNNGVFTFQPATTYTLPTASTGVLGGVKVDGTTITIANGIISASAAAGASALSDLTDVLISGPITTGYVLKYNGSKWSPAADATVGGGGTDADTLDGFDGTYYLDYAHFTGNPNLTVTTTSASGGGTLSYSSGTFTFAPADLSGYATTSSLSSYATTSSLSSYVTALTLSSYNYIDLTDLSIGTPASASGSGSIAYNNNTGVFTYTPPDLSGYYSTSNPNGYTSNTGTVTSVSGAGTVSGLTLTGTVTTTGSLTLGGSLTLTSGNVTSALGYTPLQASSLSVTTNPTGTNALSYSNGVFTFTPYSYTLPAATTTTLGGVIVPTVTTSGITNSSGTIGLATASTTQLGGVKVDGTTITITDGVIASGYSINQNLSTTSNVTFNNTTVTGIFYPQQINEAFQTYSTTITAASTVALDCSSGNAWYITSTVQGNWTANLQNLNLTTGLATNVTLIIVQGVTPYIPNVIQIGGVGQTINWQGGSAPTGNASKKDAIAISVLCTASNTYVVFGQLVTFG